MNKIIKSLEKGLIVSCQARPGNPLRGPEHMAAMAKAAEMGGAVAVRADAPADISKIKKRISIPVIGIYKTTPSKDIPYITPDFEHAADIAKCGVEIIALDATLRNRPDGTDLKELIPRIKEELETLVMADIATLEEGVAAAKAGADLVATTLSGYTSYTALTKGPDLKLIRNLKESINVPVIAEGRFTSPEDMAEGFKAGAYAIVIGKAITNIEFSTRRFIQETNLLI